MRSRFPIIIAMLVCLWFTTGPASTAEPAVTLTIQADRPGARISPTMWGIFFEDINFGADGGLYAELVKNGSFEFPNPKMGWRTASEPGALGMFFVWNQNPVSPANPHYIMLGAFEGGEGVAIENEGFRGMGLKEGAAYVFSMQARLVEGQPALRAELLASDGRTLASAKLAGFKGQWQKHTATLRSTATDAKARL